MRRGLRKRLTFANVMSAIAVFVALGGTAVAVGKLPKNSVGAKQIKKNAVNSSKVKDGSLQSGDFAAGVLQAGKQGKKGEPGQPATKIYAFIRTGSCCGGSPPLEPPLILDGHGVTSAAVGGTGQYEVTFDKSLLPDGNVENCVPLATLGSADAGFPMEGTVSVGHPAGIPQEKLLVLYRDTGGSLAVLNNGGGSPGFSIALFC